MPTLALPEIPDVGSERLMGTVLVTHNGQRLSPKEYKFIDLYIKLADAAEAAEQAGYTVREHYKNKKAQYLKRGESLLAKDYIQDEIAYRMKEFRRSQIADTEEILLYLSKVMRGEEKDQFGLDVSIADRTAAAKELNRRIHELDTATKQEGSQQIIFSIERRG